MIDSDAMSCCRFCYEKCTQVPTADILVFLVLAAWKTTGVKFYRVPPRTTALLRQHIAIQFSMLKAAGMEVKGTDLCDQCALDVVSGRGRELKEVLEITGLAEVTLAPELDGEAPELLNCTDMSSERMFTLFVRSTGRRICGRSGRCAAGLDTETAPQHPRLPLPRLTYHYRQEAAFCIVPRIV